MAWLGSSLLPGRNPGFEVSVKPGLAHSAIYRKVSRNNSSGGCGRFYVQGHVTRAYAEMWRGFYAAMPNADYDWAAALPTTLVAGGLTEVESSGDVDLVRGETPAAELLGLTVEAVRERIPGDIDVDAGLAVLADPTAFEPGIVWYSAWGRRE